MNDDNNKPEEQNIKNEKIKKEKDKKEKDKKEKDKKVKKGKNDKKDLKSELYIYFIENHISDCRVELDMDKIKYAADLEQLCGGEFEKNENEYLYTIYRFKYFPLEKKAKEEVNIILIDENNNKFYSKIKVKEYDKDIFLYDLKFIYNNSSKKAIPPESYPLTHQEQFNYYIEFIRRKLNIKQDTFENISFILSIQKLLEGGEEYEFSFYLLIFLECFGCQAIRNHLMIFNPDKIKGSGELNPEKIYLLNNLLQIIKIKSLKYVENLEDEKEKETCKINFDTIFVYFNYLFNNEKFKELLDNKEYENNIYNALLNNNKLFEKEILSEDQLQILIKKVPKYNQLTNALRYNNGILNLFQVIKNSFKKILELYNAESDSKSKIKKKNLIIKIDKIASANINDDLEEISKIYIELIDLQMDNVNTIFILFSEKICKEYIYHFEKKNVQNLFSLKKIIRALEKKGKIRLELKEKNKTIYIDKIIHETGLELSKNKILKNNEILDFIEKDIIANKSSYKDDTSFAIFFGINIDSLDKQFYEKWKEINWRDIYGDKYSKFLERISNFVTDLKDFHILFKLFNINKKEDKFLDFDIEAIELMQNKFKNITNKFVNGKIFENINEILVLLIFYSELKKFNVEKFLKNIQISIDYEIIIAVYIELIKRYKDLISNETKNIITNFFIDSPDNSNSDTLLFLIDNCQDLLFEILKRLERFKFEKKNFWEKEENDKLKLFRGLLQRNYIKGGEFGMTDYSKETIKMINELHNDIIDGNILYREINYFYEGNKKHELHKRLLLISLNNEVQANDFEAMIDTYMEKNKKIIKDLELVNEDLVEFLRKKENESIKALGEMITAINKGKLNCFKNNYEEKYNYLMNKFKLKAEIRSLKKTSLFFKEIFAINSKLYKEKDEERINETEKQFDKLNIIFSDKGVHNLDEDLLQICLNSIKGKQENFIDREIQILIDIFKKEILDIKKKELIESLIILSKKEDIYKVAIAISIFIEKTEVIKDDFYTNILNIISTLKTSNKEDDIRKSMKYLEKGSIYIDIIYETNKIGNYVNILLKLKELPDSIIFLFRRTVADCRSLQELVGEMDDGFLTSNDILELEKCVEFMNQIGNEQTIKSMKGIDIIKSFVNEVNKNKKIEVYFEKYVNNYSQLKNLIEYGLDKSEASKQKIKSICQQSAFILKSIKGEFFKGKYIEINEENDKAQQKSENKTNEKELNLEDLLELRDRAQLSKKMSGEKEEQKQFFENNRKFIEKVNEIYNIYCLLKNLNISGYPEDITIEIKINNYISEFYGLGQKYKEYQSIISILKSMLSNFRKYQINGYEEKPLIRFIYGRQFNMIYNHLKRKETNKIEPFLMFLTNNLMKYSHIDFIYKSNSNIYEDIINNSEKYLEELLLKNSLTLEQIYKDSLIYENYNYKGVYMYFCKKIEKDLFQIYKYLTKKTPIAQNILLCTKETSNEELTAFLYRALLCEFNSCFIIGGIELLEFDQKNKILELLNNLFANKHDNMKSCLIILYTNNRTDIYKSLNLLRHKQDLNIKTEDVESLKIDDSNAEIISSDKSGVGKSTQIRLEIDKARKTYIHFPFGGVFKREEVVKRLKSQNFSKNSVLHLDLYDTDQTELMTEFLFSILITKLYGQNEDMFYLSKGISIKVEIPNGFVDFINKFPILTLFPNRILLIKNLPPLIVPNEIDSNIQIVANYLKALKNNEINDKDLFITDVLQKNFLTMIQKFQLKFYLKVNAKN